MKQFLSILHIRFALSDAIVLVSNYLFQRNSYSLVPSKGNATVELKVMKENGTLSEDSLVTHIPHVSGQFFYNKVLLYVVLDRNYEPIYIYND